MGLSWQSCGIFISSTFADMQAERDHLRTFVFPAIEEQLRDRRCHLEWVDLRLGVASASIEDGLHRELHVLKVCLAEVRRCRPFMIVLLGDRYGWVPPADRIGAAAQEEGITGEIANLSVTDLEIRFGILNDIEQQPRSFFYFREGLPYSIMSDETAALYSDTHAKDRDAADRSRRLTSLKQEIESRLPNRVRRYAPGWDTKAERVTDLHAWGEQVVRDILREFEDDFRVVNGQSSVQPTDRIALDDFIEERRHNFVGREMLLTLLEDRALSGLEQSHGWSVCLTGESGSGKSAVFAELYRRLKNRDLLVLAHATGASARSSFVDEMLRGWLDELSAHLNLERASFDSLTSEEVEAHFHELMLLVAQQGRLAVLIDGLDQFETTTRGRFMTWLPANWPENAMLIATAIPGDASRSLCARVGVEHLSLQPVNASEALAITRGICLRYHRTLEPEVIDALLARRKSDVPAWFNTLWLVLAVEELNLVDADDFARAGRTYPGTPAEQLRALMVEIANGLPADVISLYERAFRRAETLFGAELPRAFLGYLAIGRNGWRESDLKALVPRSSGEIWSNLRFATLRRLFRGQIRRRGSLGQWNFNHTLMSVAVRQYLSACGVNEMELNREAADHLLSLSADDPLQHSEVMVHLMRGGNPEKTADFFGGGSLTSGQLDGATRALSEMILEISPGASDEGLKQVLSLLGDAPPGHDLTLIRRTARLAERILFNLETGLAGRVNLSVRSIILQKLRSVLVSVSSSGVPSIGWQRSLALCESQLSEVLYSQGKSSEALGSFDPFYRSVRTLADADSDNPERLRDLAQAEYKRATLFYNQLKPHLALDSFRSCETIFERLAKSEPSNFHGLSDLATVKITIGTILDSFGDYLGALEVYASADLALQQCRREDPTNIDAERSRCAAQEGLSETLANLGRFSEAIAASKLSVAIADRLSTADPNDADSALRVCKTKFRLGSILVQASDLEGALGPLTASVQCAERISAGDPENFEYSRALAASLCAKGNALFELNRIVEGRDCIRSGVAILKHLCELDPDNAGLRSDLAASHIDFGDAVRRTDLSGAIGAYKEATNLCEALAERYPENPAMQRHFAISFGRLCKFSINQAAPHNVGVAGKLLSLYQQRAEQQPHNLDWQHQWAVLLTYSSLCAADRGEFDVARAWNERAREIMREVTLLGQRDEFKEIISQIEWLAEKLGMAKPDITLSP